MATEVNSFASSSRFIKLGADLGRCSRPPAPRSQHIVEFYQACCPALPMAAYCRAQLLVSQNLRKSYPTRGSGRETEGYRNAAPQLFSHKHWHTETHCARFVCEHALCTAAVTWLYARKGSVHVRLGRKRSYLAHCAVGQETLFLPKRIF